MDKKLISVHPPNKSVQGCFYTFATDVSNGFLAVGITKIQRYILGAHVSTLGSGIPKAKKNTPQSYKVPRSAASS